MSVRFDRAVVCLGDEPSVDALLTSFAALTRVIHPSSIEIVAAATHGLHDRRRETTRATYGGAVDTIHLAPSALDTVSLGLSLADRNTLVVAGGESIRRLPKRPHAPCLALRGPLEQRSVVALVDPQHDTPAAITTAIDLADRLGARQVVALHVYFDEGAIVSDEFEDRVRHAHLERMHILLARVPDHASVSLTTRLVQAPDPTRALARIAADVDAGLVVGVPPAVTALSALTLPDAVVRPSAPQAGLRALWDAVVWGPQSSTA